MNIAIGAALVAAFIAIIWVVTYQPSRRKPASDLGIAFQRGRAKDLAVLRQCWNHRALQTRTVRSISGVRG